MHPAMDSLVRRDSNNQFDRSEIAFILAVFPWLKLFKNEGGAKTGVPAENP